MKKPRKRIIYSNYNLDEDYPDECLKERLLDDGYAEEEITDEMLWNRRYEYDEVDWDCARSELTDFFEDGSTWIAVGTCGLWTGNHAAGTVFRKFNELLDGLKDCDYFEFYDENGHLYMKGDHHDGTNAFEIKRVTDAGVKYYDNWESSWDDDRSEQEVHKQIFERYSTLPRFAENVYGCKKVDWEEVA